MALPVRVVVERKIARSSKRCLRGAISVRAASTSPTETAWIQIEGRPCGVSASGSRPIRSRKVFRCFLPPFSRKSGATAPRSRL
jgi:hypothetical protein